MIDTTRLQTLAVLVAMGVGAPRLVSAQEPGPPDPIVVAFEYEAPSECLNEEQAFSLLHRRSRRVTRGSSAQLQLNVKIGSDAAEYRGVLTVIRAGQVPERRSMSGGSCAEVVEALALTAALSIDPDATVTLGSEAVGLDTSQADQEPTPAAFAPDEEGSPADTARPSDEEPLPSSPDRLRANLGPALILTRLMDHAMHVGAGVVFAVSHSRPGTWLPLEARLSVYRLREMAPVGAPGIETSIVASRLAYCPFRVGDDLSLQLCPVSQVGALSAQSRGFSEDGRMTRVFATLGLEAWSRARIARHVDLWVSSSLEVPLTERSFAVDPGPEILVSTVNLAWSVSAGVGFSF